MKGRQVAKIISQLLLGLWRSENILDMIYTSGIHLYLIKPNR